MATKTKVKQGIKIKAKEKQVKVKQIITMMIDASKLLHLVSLLMDKTYSETMEAFTNNSKLTRPTATLSFLSCLHRETLVWIVNDKRSDFENKYVVDEWKQVLVHTLDLCKMCLNLCIVDVSKADILKF